MRSIKKYYTFIGARKRKNENYVGGAVGYIIPTDIICDFKDKVSNYETSTLRLYPMIKDMDGIIVGIERQCEEIDDSVISYFVTNKDLFHKSDASSISFIDHFTKMGKEYTEEEFKEKLLNSVGRYNKTLFSTRESAKEAYAKSNREEEYTCIKFTCESDIDSIFRMDNVVDVDSDSYETIHYEKGSTYIHRIDISDSKSLVEFVDHYINRQISCGEIKRGDDIFITINRLQFGRNLPTKKYLDEFKSLERNQSLINEIGINFILNGSNRTEKLFDFTPTFSKLSSLLKENGYLSGCILLIDSDRGMGNSYGNASEDEFIMFLQEKMKKIANDKNVPVIALLPTTESVDNDDIKSGSVNIEFDTLNSFNRNRRIYDVKNNDDVGFKMKPSEGRIKDNMDCSGLTFEAVDINEVFPPAAREKIDKMMKNIEKLNIDAKDTSKKHPILREWIKNDALLRCIDRTSVDYTKYASMMKSAISQKMRHPDHIDSTILELIVRRLISINSILVYIDQGYDSFLENIYSNDAVRVRTVYSLDRDIMDALLSDKTLRKCVEEYMQDEKNLNQFKEAYNEMISNVMSNEDEFIQFIQINIKMINKLMDKFKYDKNGRYIILSLVRDISIMLNMIQGEKLEGVVEISRLFETAYTKNLTETYRMDESPEMEGYESPSEEEINGYINTWIGSSKTHSWTSLKEMLNSWIKGIMEFQSEEESGEDDTDEESTKPKDGPHGNQTFLDEFVGDIFHHLSKDQIHSSNDSNESDDHDIWKILSDFTRYTESISDIKETVDKETLCSEMKILYTMIHEYGTRMYIKEDEYENVVKSGVFSNRDVNPFVTLSIRVLGLKKNVKECIQTNIDIRYLKRVRNITRECDKLITRALHLFNYTGSEYESALVSQRILKSITNMIDDKLEIFQKKSDVSVVFDDISEPFDLLDDISYISGRNEKVNMMNLNRVIADINYSLIDKKIIVRVIDIIDEKSDKLYSDIKSGENATIDNTVPDIVSYVYYLYRYSHGDLLKSTLFKNLDKSFGAFCDKYGEINTTEKDIFGMLGNICVNIEKFIESNNYVPRDIYNMRGLIRYLKVCMEHGERRCIQSEHYHTVCDLVKKLNELVQKLFGETKG